MAYDEKLAKRIRVILSARKNIVERKMFGGVCFQLKGHILVGVWKKSLIVRLGRAAAPAALREPYVREFDITGRPLTGWAMIAPAAIEDDDQLRNWIDRATRFVKTLPKKN